MYIIVPFANNPWQEMILPASQLVFCRQGFFFLANFEIENVAKIFKNMKQTWYNLHQKKNTSKCFPVFIFSLLDGKSNKICQEKLLGTAGEVLCTSCELLDYRRGAGGFFLVVGLAFSSQSMSHSLIHSLLTRRKASHYHHPSHCWVITYL